MATKATTSEAPKVSKPRTQPTFSLVPVEAPPAPAPRATNTELTELLVQIVNDETKWGNWFQVAEYHNRNSASQTAEAFSKPASEKGHRATPTAPDGLVWQFAPRTFRPDESNPRLYHSRLYVRLTTPDQVEQDASDDADDGDGDGDGD
jgi:hypothetical protein